MDSYQYLLTSLCKYGLPTGDLYEFSALTVLRYEKKLKAQRKKELEERLKQRNDQKTVAHIIGRGNKKDDPAGSPEVSPSKKINKKKKAVEEESKAATFGDAGATEEENKESRLGSALEGAASALDSQTQEEGATEGNEDGEAPKKRRKKKRTHDMNDD